jgi:uncharacterized membrane protein (DUF4010 family)
VSVYEPWIRLGVGLAIGLLIGLERERSPAAVAGVRTFALLALFGALAAMVAERTQDHWLTAAGLVAVAALLIGINARAAPKDDPGTTTIAAGCVCYLLGVLSGIGDPTLAGALAIVVTALLYFKPEIEGLSSALGRHEQVSVLQFLVASFIVLPMLPDQTFGPYAALNPRSVWMMVVLISGVGLASHVALRVAGERHGVLLAGLLGGLVSSTATTVLYARRSSESEAMRRLALVVVPIANLVPLLRIALLSALVAPAIIPALLPVLAAALLAGIAVLAPAVRRIAAEGAAPVPESRNPAAIGAALRFAVVLFASAALSEHVGSYGVYAAALASGMVDIDPILLSAFSLFEGGRLVARQAVATVALAYSANVAFKLAVMFWYDRPLARHAAWPLGATVAGGALAWIGLR